MHTPQVNYLRHLLLSGINLLAPTFLAYSTQRKTSLDYQIFRCRGGKAMFNEHTETPFNDLQFPADIVLMVVL